MLSGPIIMPGTSQSLSSHARSLVAPRESLQWLAVVLVGVAGNASGTIKPVLIGSYVKYFGLSPRLAGYLLAAEMTAAALSVLASAVLLAHLPQRRFVLTAIGLILVGNIGASLSPEPTVLFVWRTLAGIGHGLALGPVSAAIARVREPDRLGGLLSVAAMGCASLLSFLVPWLQVTLGGRGLFCAMALTVPLAWLGARWFPEHSARPDGSRIQLPAMPPLRVTLVASVGSLLWYLVVGDYWPYVEQFARAANIDYATAARILGWATLISIAGACLSIVIGSRFGRVRTLASLFTLQFAGLLLMLFDGSQVSSYCLSAAFFVFSWVAIFPYLLGLMSQIDPGGRLNGLLYTMGLLGYAIGPAAAGYIVGLADSTARGLINIQWITLVLLPASALTLLGLAVTRRLAPRSANQPA
jgi:MFS family permease